MRFDNGQDFMAGHEGKLGDEPSMEQVLVGSADAGLQHSQQHVTVAGGGPLN